MVKCVFHFKSGKTKIIQCPDDINFPKFISNEFDIPAENGRRNATAPAWSLYNGLAVNWDFIEFVEEVVE